MVESVEVGGVDFGCWWCVNQTMLVMKRVIIDSESVDNVYLSALDFEEPQYLGFKKKHWRVITLCDTDHTHFLSQDGSFMYTCVAGKEKALIKTRFSDYDVFKFETGKGALEWLVQ